MGLVLMKKWVILAFVMIYAFFALSAVGEDMHIEGERRYKAKLIQEFQILLDQDDHDNIPLYIRDEAYSDIKAQYKAMTLSYIHEKTDSIVEQVRNNEMDLAKAKEALDALQSLLAEVDGLFQSFEMVDTLQQSDMHYALGVASYDGLDYEGARNELMQVDKIHESYDDARIMIKVMDDFNALWEARITNHQYGRSAQGLAYMEGWIVFPHVVDGVTMLVRHHVKTLETKVIPITRQKGKYRIEGINLIGDDIYFIAGEEVGTGYMLEHPYNIYRVKKDGSDLTCLGKGHFFDLLCYEDRFYALSYTEGLVQFDRHMMHKEVISQGDILSMYPCSQGVYYTQRKDYGYGSHDSLFLYDGEKHHKQFSGRNLRCYYYDDQILYHRYAYGDVEYIYRSGYDKDSHKRLFNVNITKFFGLVGDSIILETDGANDQRQYLTYDVASGKSVQHSKKYDIINYEVVGACVESEQLLVRKDRGVYLADVGLSTMSKIEIPSVKDAVITSNQAVLLENDYFSEQERIVKLEDAWYYSHGDTSISVERRYMQSHDATVYIAHVRTKEPNDLDVGYYDKVPGRTRARADEIARVNDAAFAVNGDFWAESNNPWTGIVIREGKVYRKQFVQDMVAILPNEGMECYSAKQDDITPEMLLEQGVVNTLSFGPVLLDDFEYGHLVDRNFLWGKNPRTAMGMISPNHYIFICCDGRSKKSRGLTLRRLAELYLELGCGEAYNLDGGQSMSIVFMGEMLNTHMDERRPCKHRYMSEIVYVPMSGK